MASLRVEPRVLSPASKFAAVVGAFRAIVAETLRRADENDYIFSLDGDDFYTRRDALSGTVKRMYVLSAWNSAATEILFCSLTPVKNIMVWLKGWRAKAKPQT